MSSTTFVDGETLILSSWLNDVNTLVYNTFGNLPVYANNAAAISGGLTAGNLYRTSIGQVMVVF